MDFLIGSFLGGRPSSSSPGRGWRTTSSSRTTLDPVGYSHSLSPLGNWLPVKGGRALIGWLGIHLSSDAQPIHLSGVVVNGFSFDPATRLVIVLRVGVYLKL